MTCFPAKYDEMWKIFLFRSLLLIKVPYIRFVKVDDKDFSQRLDPDPQIRLIYSGLMRYKYIRFILTTDQAEILPWLGEVLFDGETTLDLPLCGDLQLSDVARLLHSAIPPRLSINQSILVATKPNQLAC